MLMDEMGWMRKKAAMGDCRTLVLKNWKEGGVINGDGEDCRRSRRGRSNQDSV